MLPFMLITMSALVVVCGWAAWSMHKLEREARQRGLRLPSFPFPVERTLHERATADAWNPADEEEFARIGIKL